MQNECDFESVNGQIHQALKGRIVKKERLILEFCVIFYIEHVIF